MANQNGKVKDQDPNQKSRPTTDRVEDEAALRNALVDASLRVKRLAQKETEAESAGEEILHFRLKAD
ncbi:MAG: hypothetical protein A3H32_15090 [Betaproteobacteria bacterium RIFCSPLOWO2_02_FULL_63_19]|nr:MAG: hypothetical protein A3H32_15090 [Betaproteobacteria bacterium RIFCSPLOWO2_02_FULL_63_19]